MATMRERQWKANNAGRIAATNRRWLVENRERAQASQKRWRVKNPDRVKAYKLRYNQKNQPKLNAAQARRNAIKLNATPLWLTSAQHAEIEEWYHIARCTNGHVDHIVPLRGENVCGLHVPWNLQILTPIENKIKGNRHDGDA